VRIIGDVHGYIKKYQQIISDCTASVQLGDMGLSDTYRQLIALVDVDLHRFIPGNHDDYSQLPPHAFPKDWDYVNFQGFQFLYIRGAYSIDKMWREPYISWWPNEELGAKAAIELVSAIAEIKPRIILSHDAPFLCYQSGLVNRPFASSYTARLLDRVFEIYQPEMWFFGHHHKNWITKIDNTMFVGLGICQYVEISLQS